MYNDERDKKLMILYCKKKNIYTPADYEQQSRLAGQEITKDRKWKMLTKYVPNNLDF